MWVKWVHTRVLVFYSSGLEPTCVRWMSDQVCTTAEDKYVTTGRINRVEKTDIMGSIADTPPRPPRPFRTEGRLQTLRPCPPTTCPMFPWQNACILERDRRRLQSDFPLSHRRVRLTFVAFKTSRTPPKHRSLHAAVFGTMCDFSPFPGRSTCKS